MLYLCYLCRFKPLRDHLRGFLIAAWAGDKIAEFSFPEISFHFSLRPWFFFVSPAYAGKRTALQLYAIASKDHPRMCGEKFRAYAKIWNEWGSPPHVRGKAIEVGQFCALGGITPACAGKSRIRAGRGAAFGDHPPRMRGKGGADGALLLTTGITPACAGKRTRNKAVGGAK